jgi:hypothetical protein
MGKQVALPAPDESASLEVLQTPLARRDEQRGRPPAIGDLVRLTVFGDTPQDLARSLPQLAHADSFHVLHRST